MSDHTNEPPEPNVPGPEPDDVPQPDQDEVDLPPKENRLPQLSPATVNNSMDNRGVCFLNPTNMRLATY